MGYMIAKIQVKYGGEAMATFNECLSHLVPALEKNGWRLLGGYRNQIGMLNEVWDIWEVRDANHIMDARVGLKDDLEVCEWAAKLSEVMVSEQLHYVEKLSYSP